MREIRALIWKEWHETRLFLWIAWGLFIGLLIVGGFEAEAMNGHRFEFWASPWIIFCGPLLAIVVGVAATCRDLHTKLEDFWQSRPMGSLQLFIVKYLVGLVVILLACGVPLAIEWFSNRSQLATEAGLIFSFLWMAVFSTAFASGCIFRRPAHAAAVAVVGVLLICFLPVIFPPLQRFNVSQVLELIDFERSWIGNPPSERPPLALVAGATLLSLVMGGVALFAVRFRWHIASEQPLIYGAAGAAFLILLESASYQLGTNLPILGSVDLPAGRRTAGGFAKTISVNGTSGTTLMWYSQGNPNDKMYYESQSFAINGSEISLGSAQPIAPDDLYWRWYGELSERNPRDPSVTYTCYREDPGGDIGIWMLETLKFPGGVPTPQGSPIELWRSSPKNRFRGFLHVWNDQLYVFGERTIVLDISDPLQPKKVSDEPLPWTRPSGLFTEDQPVVELPHARGVSAAERLPFALACCNLGGCGVFDGTVWCREMGEERAFRPRDAAFAGLEEERLESLTEDAAHFSVVAKYTPTLVQRTFDGQIYNPLKLKNGLLYCMQDNCVNIFDMTGPRPLRLIAHFAAPSVQAMQPLDDGRIIAAGDKLYLLGPPPRR